MQIKILIRTPKGQAQKAEQKLRLFLLKTKKPTEVYTNDLDNEICWIIEGDPRYINKLQHKVTQYHSLMNMALNNKMVKSVIRKKVSKEGAEELYDMLINQTEVTVVKAATAEELAKNKESVFFKIKNLFSKDKKQDDNSKSNE